MDKIYLEYMIFLIISFCLLIIFLMEFVSVHFYHQNRLFTDPVIDQEIHMCCLIHGIFAFIRFQPPEIADQHIQRKMAHMIQAGKSFFRKDIAQQCFHKIF